MIDSLFLDLDDTIFPTRSIGQELVQPFINQISRYVATDQVASLENDLWTKPFTYVFHKYALSDQQVTECLAKLNDVDLKGKIRPYDDYQVVKNLAIKKFLITTSTTDFQVNKIEALQIENDFLDIFIDDSLKSSGGKAEAFRFLIEKHSLDKRSILVIGDNPDSEIKAGKALGISTVLIHRNSSNHHHKVADYLIQSFEELPALLELING